MFAFSFCEDILFCLLKATIVLSCLADPVVSTCLTWNENFQDCVFDSSSIPVVEHEPRFYQAMPKWTLSSLLLETSFIPSLFRCYLHKSYSYFWDKHCTIFIDILECFQQTPATSPFQLSWSSSSLVCYVWFGTSFYLLWFINLYVTFGLDVLYLFRINNQKTNSLVLFDHVEVYSMLFKLGLSL